LECGVTAQPVLTLAGRAALVSGGTRNLGRAIAEQFAQSGVRVAVIGQVEGSTAHVVAQIRERGGEAIGIGCDVTDRASVASAVERTITAFGGLDIVVNSAGVLDMLPVRDMTVEQWDRVMAINLKGTFLVTQQALPALEKSHAPRVINLSSNAGRMGGFENGMAYTASKGGVVALTYGLARQLAPHGITVNCIAPGTIDSDMLRARDDATRARLLARFPLGRFGSASEVAAAACYFASEEAAFTTGAVLDVNGGLFMG
jgi:3-oxoacyl-[acyl-carrier protein] reductase